MTTEDDDVKVTLTAETRAIQASIRNKANKATACQTDLDDGNDLFDIVSKNYWTKVYLNYNGKTIAVKVDSARAVDELAADNDPELKRFCKVHNVVKRTVGRSIIYHLPYSEKSGLSTLTV